MAGVLCNNKGLLGPAILNFYTSSFHNLESFLALNGIMYFYPTLVWSCNERQIDYKQTVIRYCKNNKWKYEYSKLSHKNRWAELKRFFNQETKTPDFILKLFDYFFQASFHNESIEKLKNFDAFKNRKHITYEDKLDEFLNRISNTRHSAAYNSFGSDPNVIDEMINREGVNPKLVNLQANSYESFSENFFNYCIDLVYELINYIDINNETRKYLFFTTYYDTFDDVIIENIKNDVAREKTRYVKDWLKGKTTPNK